jgi:hypothetical protein
MGGAEQIAVAIGDGGGSDRMRICELEVIRMCASV